MKPKEKAKEVYNRFFELTPKWLENDRAIDLAKLNSLTAIKLVLSTNLFANEKNYWLNVFDKIKEL